ncbi:hypothetical protein Glove_194g99 [Diversispora epigaea]|uniref:Uncharacterized protein n=1 Tax=Diversispora epigaea TaxID=1348612 RepID=A0A397IPE2_9GLOM|nr:hypothetical protein Glove_194g99 [Diversispora epigaea]
MLDNWNTGQHRYTKRYWEHRTILDNTKNTEYLNIENTGQSGMLNNTGKLECVDNNEIQQWITLERWKILKYWNNGQSRTFDNTRTLDNTEVLTMEHWTTLEYWITLEHWNAGKFDNTEATLEYWD